MSRVVPLFEKRQDLFVPYYKLRIDNRPVGKDVVFDVMQVTYKDSLDAIDSCEFTVNNELQNRGGANKFKYSDADIFNPGKKIELEMGYYGAKDSRVMLRGEIVSLKPSFPASGQSSVAVSALNVLHKFRKKQRSDVYEKQTDSQVAQRIGKKLGVKMNIVKAAKEPVYDYLIQDNKYDILFLMERARRGGYDLFVEEKDGKEVLNFRATEDVKGETYELRYGRSLVQFQPKLTTANQVAKVTVQGWDPVKKKKIKQTVTRKEVAASGKLERDFSKAFEEREEVITHIAVTDDAEARELATKALTQNVKGFVTGSGSVIGLPDLRAGRTLQLTGLGERFSGRYFVTSTTHTIGSSGYTTSFECRREDL